MSGPPGVLRTARLWLTPLDPAADADDLHAVWGDPEVAGPMGEGDLSSSVPETRHRLVSLQRPGMRQWVLRLAPDGAALGVAGSFAPSDGGVMGLSWRLRRDHWGTGLMSEAAPIVVDQLLNDESLAVDGVEAWIASTNTRSLGVARHAGLTLRGYLPLSAPGAHASQLVLGRRRRETPPAVLSVTPALAVGDVAGTATILAEVLGMRVAFAVGDPPDFIRLGADIWSAGPAIDVVASRGQQSGPVEVYVEVTDVDAVHAAAERAGLVVDGAPATKPWHRREFAVVLDEGHRVRVGGPT